MRLYRSLCLFLYFILLFSSCRITRRVPEGNYLLNSNIVNVDNKKVSKSELKSFIRQKTNRRILGFYRFHLRLYNLADFGEERKVKNWFKNTIGEAPVILDSNLAEITTKQHLLYLHNIGYFKAQTQKEIRFNGRKANVIYNVQTGDPFLINSIEYEIEDVYVKTIVLSDTSNSLVKPLSTYNVNVFQSERERISRKLKNSGYYNFSREFIFFEADSSIGNNMINLKIIIRNPMVRSQDSLRLLIPENHKRYILNNIFINPQNYIRRQGDTLSPDTVFIQVSQRKNKDLFNNYYFIYYKEPRLNPKIITQSVFFRDGRFFNLDDVEQSYKRLSELRNFRFINIQFEENKDTLQEHPYLRMLDSKIELTRMPVHFYDLATDVTNSAGNLGLAGNISYQNKNLFRNAEIFGIRLKGAMEVQRIIGDNNPDEVIEQLPFNTIETGINSSLEIPMFLIPISPEKFPRYFKPKTTFNLGFNYQRRPDYTRYILNTSFGYEWRESEEKKHVFQLLDINSVKIYPDSLFVEVINSIKDKRLQLSYKDHLSVSLKYSFIYNTQKVGSLVDFFYFRGNFESSGNALRLFSNIIDAPIDEFGSYKIFKIRYAQFLKFDIDYRYYHIVNSRSLLAFRAFGGLGLPYGNLTVIPFDKAFYAGGTNGIRAWKIYQLGPGGFNDVSGSGIYKTGDIHLESNIEYRFDIYSYLKGAMFVDAGNIWFRTPNDQFPNAEFKLNNFYKEIAIGGGIGARLDFSFFIVRFDAAIPLRNPANPEGERWEFNNILLKKVNFNLGIGYPF
ncbi:MAG: BamA/TamA family outer membrane protein [Bacteroidales bacterium]|nr:BamA/TamA family outer membrane protein [Bacteroidales bacterium]